MILFYDFSLSLSWIFFLAVQNGSQLPANDLGLPLPHQQRRAVPCKAKAESVTVLLGGGSAGNMLALRSSSTLSKPANWRWICKDLPFHESGERKSLEKGILLDSESIRRLGRGWHFE